MDERDIFLTGKIWDDHLELKEKGRILREMLKKRGFPYIDYRLGPRSPFSRFRPRTKTLITQYLEEKGDLFLFVHSKISEAV
ncbi:hypothetical protein ES703_61703 [subsurface metagenome]